VLIASDADGKPPDVIVYAGHATAKSNGPHGRQPKHAILSDRQRTHLRLEHRRRDQDEHR
jgi:hypothetical protein